jgi:hypothetical protein
MMNRAYRSLSAAWQHLFQKIWQTQNFLRKCAIISQGVSLITMFGPVGNHRRTSGLRGGSSRIHPLSLKGFDCTNLQPNVYAPAKKPLKRPPLREVCIQTIDRPFALRHFVDVMDQPSLKFLENTPRMIAEALLARSGAAMFDRDFDRFADCFFFPNVVETIDGVQEVVRPENLRCIFDKVLREFRRNGINRMERNIIEASFRDANTISCTHQSRLLNGTHLIQRPYPVFTVIERRTDKVWRIASGVYGLSNTKECENAITSHILNGSEPLD